MDYLNVTTTDIQAAANDGDPDLVNAQSCPIAQALRRRLKIDAHSIWVGKETFTFDKWATEYELPQKAKVFIRKWDDSEHVEPFYFKLEKIEDESV